MTEFVKVAGVETPIEVAQILNKIINEKGNIDLDNLSELGEKRFSDLSSSITDVKNSVSSLTTTVNGKIGATVSKAANGYIKFTNGMILQWGSFTGGDSISITFPVAFSSACHGLSFVTTRARDTSRLAGTHLNSAPSTTKFVASSINTNGGGSGVIKTNVRWIATGY